MHYGKSTSLCLEVLLNFSCPVVSQGLRSAPLHLQDEGVKERI
jgi:hypothetical protein